MSDIFYILNIYHVITLKSSLDTLVKWYNVPNFGVDKWRRSPDSLLLMSGRGDTTVRNVIVETCKLIVDHLWENHVQSPASEEEMKKATQELDMILQATGAFSGLDGCHIPIKCPSGGGKSRKEY